MKSATKQRGKKEIQKRSPLYVQIKESEDPGLLSKKSLAQSDEFIDHDRDDSQILNSKLTKKVLSLSASQIQEEETAIKAGNAFSVAEKIQDITDADQEDWEVDVEEGEDVELTFEEEELLQKYMDDIPQRNLSNLIMEKLAQVTSDSGSALSVPGNAISEKIIEVYTQVGLHLARYRSGKVPKAFRVIPSLRNWEQILQLTNPEAWTPQATVIATKLFSSNLNAKMAQRFYNTVLLPKVLLDISTHKKLNFHYFQCLKDALFKPAAFFKGILLPMAIDGCSLREAMILGSVLRKFSIPAIHSGVAILKLTELEYSPSRIFLIKTLLNKKYSLPRRVLDSVVKYFLNFFQWNGAPLPVVWHQALLVLAQRYKCSLNANQKDGLKQLLKLHEHRIISKEIHRELFLTNSQTNDIEMS